MKLNPKQLEKAMKQFGVTQQDIDATLVVIHTPSHEIHITNPHVARVIMMGQETYQVSGTAVEKHTRTIDISEEDIQTVMDSAGVTRDKAHTAITKHNGDLAAAILDLNG